MLEGLSLRIKKMEDNMLIIKDLYGEIIKVSAAGGMYAKNNRNITAALPELKKMGEKVPVFAKIAGLAGELVDGKYEGSDKLLELSNLLNAILSTQIEYGLKTDYVKLEFNNTIKENISYKNFMNNSFMEKIEKNNEYPLLEKEEELLKDLRWTAHAFYNADKYSNINFKKVIDGSVKRYGLKLLSFFGYYGDDGNAGEFILNRIKEEKSENKRLSLIQMLGMVPEKEESISELITGSKPQRIAAIKALIMQNSDKALAKLVKAIKGKDFEEVIEELSKSENENYRAEYFKSAREYLKSITEEEDKKKIKDVDIKRLYAFAENIINIKSEESINFIVESLEKNTDLICYDKDQGVLHIDNASAHRSTVGGTLALNLIKMSYLRPEVLNILEGLQEKNINYLTYSMLASMKINRDEVFKIYSPFSVKKETKDHIFMAFYMLNNLREYINPDFDQRWFAIMLKQARTDEMNKFSELWDETTIKAVGDNYIELILKEKYISWQYVTTFEILLEKKYPLESKLIEMILKCEIEPKYYMASIIEKFSQEGKDRLRKFAYDESDLESLSLLDKLMDKKHINKCKKELQNILK